MPLSVIEKAMALFPEPGLFECLRSCRDQLDHLRAWARRTQTSCCSHHRDTERRRLVSVGRPLPGVEIEIRDEDGQISSRG